jgi:hypothetical protein
MPNIPESLTMAAAVFCGVFAVLITINSGYGGEAAVLTILSVFFFIASVVPHSEWLRKILVWFSSGSGGGQ